MKEIDYWKDRKHLNYDMKIEFDIPKNMKYIIMEWKVQKKII